MLLVVFCCWCPLLLLLWEKGEENCLKRKGREGRGVGKGGEGGGITQRKGKEGGMFFGKGGDQKGRQILRFWTSKSTKKTKKNTTLIGVKAQNPYKRGGVHPSPGKF